MSINISEHLSLLGKKVHDCVTGFEGVVTSITFDLYGCVQVLVHPGMGDDKKMGEQLWFDANRLVIKDAVPIMGTPDFILGVEPKGPAEKPVFNKS
ncbi:MAG TPA: hypothetical protein VJZ27_14205 [Aggregatilineales bacterium]|nr:hypothetical protein [Aggregatilineales bacterium]